MSGLYIFWFSVRKCLLDLIRCYSSVKNGPMFGKKADMETNTAKSHMNIVTTTSKEMI